MQNEERDNTMKKTLLSKIFKVSLTLIIAAMTLCSCAAESVSYDSMSAKGDVMYNAAPEMEYFSTEEYATSYDGVMLDGSINYKADSEEFYPEAPQVQNAPTETGSTSTQNTRKIIYSSSYDVETKEFDESVAALEVLCNKYGAYFESANVYSSGGSARHAHYMVRVPVENYKAFVGEADSVGVVVRSSQDNKDITESYFDTEARLESAKIREERVLEILKNSAMLDDVLALERELADIRYEIESYTGTLRKYDSLVSYATVSIDISEVKEYVAPKPVTVSFGERMSSSFEDGVEQFKEGFQDVLVFLSYNCIPLIIWIIVIIVLVFVIKFIIKKIARMIDNIEKKSYEKYMGGVVKTEDSSEKNETSEKKDSKSEACENEKCDK